MKKLIFSMFCLTILFSGGALAQHLVGESDPFEFNTQGAQAVPLTPFAVVLTLLLVSSFLLYRFKKQRNGANA